MSQTSFDTIIVGGGLVGAAVAYGLVGKGRSVAILDGEDRDFRASRGNFGLVWVQGKGANHAAYAKWSGLAAKMWPAFERKLRDAFQFDKINYLLLMMVDRHLHFHVIPRYAETRSFAGVEWPDPAWPKGPPALDQAAGGKEGVKAVITKLQA